MTFFSTEKTIQKEMHMLNIIELAGSSRLVEGTDARGNAGSEILDGSQWDSIKRRDDMISALDRVDAAIAEWVAPVQEAIDAFNDEANRSSRPDPLFYVVEQEGSKGVPDVQEVLTKLTRDSVLLRAIEEGQQDRLIWVNGELVITKDPVPQPMQVPALEPETPPTGPAPVTGGSQL